MSIRLSAMFLGTAFLFVLVSASPLQAQAQFSIRAASAQRVEGWQQMQVEHSNRVIWVSPDATVVASDVESAQTEINPVDGATRITVVFTDAGLKKIHDLTTAQLKKLVAMVVDGKVIWAPMVMAVQEGRQGVLTGNLPTGLTQEEVERILAVLR